MNFYSPVSNTRCHSIEHKMRIARIKIWVDSQGRWERALRGKVILKKVWFWVWNGILVREWTSFRYQEGVIIYNSSPMCGRDGLFRINDAWLMPKVTICYSLFERITEPSEWSREITDSWRIQTWNTETIVKLPFCQLSSWQIRCKWNHFQYWT